MEKREKIILSLALVAVLYGLIDFFILSNKDQSGQTEQLIADADQKTQNFVARSLSKITEMEMVRKQNEWQTLISKIETNWEQDPFVQNLKSKTSGILSVSDIIYSGYIMAENNLFAVINGIEYKTGELIKKYEYKVINITPQKIVLQKNLKQGTVYIKEN
jgi:hypothetical protein